MTIKKKLLNSLNGLEMSMQWKHNLINVLMDVLGIKDTSNADKKKMIKFTVFDVSYQAEEGMTWEQFINSSYNDGSFASDNFYNTVTRNGNYISKGDGNFVKITELVISNHEYTGADV